MALEIEDKDSQFSLKLWNAQTLASDQQAALDADPKIQFDSDDTFLSSLEQEGSADIAGIATGQRISRLGNYPSDSEKALAKWYAKFLTLVNGAQGNGFKLVRNYRNDSFEGMVSDIRVSRQGGDPLSLQWNLTFQRGQGFDTQRNPDPISTSPGGDYKVDGETFDGIREWSVQKTQDVTPYRLAYIDSPDENDLTSESGAQKRVTVVGEVTGNASTRNTFDDNITSSLAQDKLIDVRDALLGTTWRGMLNNYEATDEAGQFRIGEFGLEFVEGRQ